MVNSKKIVEEYFDCIPKRDFDKARKLMHREYTYISADGQRHKGAEAGIEVAEMYTRAFPDLRIELQHTYVAGNVVIVEFLAHGTHKGELFGIAPTGKKIKSPVCNIIEVKDDKIHTEREYYDSVALLQQLGVSMPGQQATA